MSIFPFASSPSFGLAPCDSGVVAFIDAGLEDYWNLISGLEAGVEAIVLQSCRDGIEQMTSVLMTNTCLDSIHVLAAGAPGSIRLGNGILSLETLDQYVGDLQVWFFLAQLCNRHPSIHLYGSNVAVGDRGLAFLRRLHHLTGAGVAASSSITGNFQRGGNWSLEWAIGAVHSKKIFRPGALTNYDGLL